ncbi:MOB kinase activator 2-like [Tropilaelaps mercedesae]|uniref:MOB kinase activator 2-like n=1 Tax=Tropilaelaps mercedesae TaxID=418985 RepID=A0A1V9X355_9ACAR|nr:MOB kinase activator 2-like [Tropilaelaps mercedesae]
MERLPDYLRETVVWLTGRGKRKEPTEEQPKIYLEDQVLECTVNEESLKELVALPDGLDYHEWLAFHTLAFFEHVNMIYGTVAEFCTVSGCPDMLGPGNRQYLWFDDRGKKCRLAAPQYVDYAMTFTQNTVTNEAFFPTKFEGEFPASFESIIKKIHGLLLAVLAHLYHGHFREILLLELHAHLNTLFSHFTLFNAHFGLNDDDVLKDLAVALKLLPKPGGDGDATEIDGASEEPSSSMAACGAGQEDERGADNPVSSL